MHSKVARISIQRNLHTLVYLNYINNMHKMVALNAPMLLICFSYQDRNLYLDKGK